LFVEAGDLAAAERYALEIVEPIDGDIETTMSYEVAAMHIDVGNGRYRSALERWRRAGPYLQRFPTWYALHVRAAIAAAFGFGDLAAGEEALRTLLSLARVGGCPSLAAFGAMLGAFLAWYKSDSRSLVKYRSEFARIAQYYDIPLLWRCLASLFGVDLEERDSYPLHDAYADLILALDGAAGARSADLIRRAVASANAAANPLLRAIARFSAIECGDSMTDELRREVVEIADSTDSDKLKESVRAACAGQSEVGLLQPLLDRLRNRAVEAPAAVAVDTPAAVAAVTGSFGIDVATGEVLRAGVPVRVSDGTLQLLVFFAVTGRPVGRDTIVDRMWPDLDGDSAVNALKMCVHRARVQLESSEAITSRKGSYALGDNVTTTYQHILDLAGAAQSRTLTDETRKELPGVYERLSRGLMAGWAAWTWFVPYTRVLTDAMRSIAKHLVLEQIERGEFQLAQQNARTMIDVEFFDESARMLLLQVYMGMGNRKAALCEYREYSNLLERELGELPSPSLQRLVGA
jgi:DNA-binding SARP family transcriptional activator